MTCTGELMSVLLCRSEGAPCVVWLCANVEKCHRVGNRSACWLVGIIIGRRTSFYSLCTSFRTGPSNLRTLETLLLRPRTGLGRWSLQLNWSNCSPKLPVAGTPKSSILIECSIIYHPAIGVPPIFGNPRRYDMYHPKFGTIQSWVKDLDSECHQKLETRQQTWRLFFRRSPRKKTPRKKRPEQGPALCSGSFNAHFRIKVIRCGANTSLI